jgi:hypothetical protein
LPWIRAFPAENRPFVIFLRPASRSHAARFVTVTGPVSVRGMHRLVQKQEYCRR